MEDSLAEIERLLKDLYTEEEIEEFLSSPQALLDNRKPIDMIFAGKDREVLGLVRSMVNGTFT